MNKKLSIYMCKILGVAITYAIAGRFGLIFAIPPGYATVIWPPSGIALAAVLLFGYQVWPGIILGSFFVNVWTGFEAGTLLELMDSLSIPIGIGSGATLQAIVGAFLIRRLAKFPNLLANEREIISFFFWGAFSCIVNSIIGVTVLFIWDRIPAANLIINMGTWWIGDTIGVFIFTPVMLIWMMYPRELFHKRRIIVTIPMLITFGLTILLVNYSISLERERLNVKFNHDAMVVSAALEKSLNSYFGILQSLQSFYAASQYVDRSEFHNFITPALTSFSGIQALSWDPLVADNNRAEFERTTRAEDFSNFHITEVDENGQLVSARQRPEYIVVHYIEPLSGNEKAMGYDVASQATRRAALEQARDSGQLAVTGRIRLIQQTDEHFGVLAVMPVYRNNLPHATIEERRHNLVGYVVAVLRPNDILKTLMTQLEEDGVIHKLFDITTTEKNLLFKCDHAVLDNHFMQHTVEKGIFSILIPHKKDVQISFGGRNWHFEVSATQEYLAKHRTEHTWLILIFGFLITSMAEVFVMLISGREILLKKVVDERTHELYKTKEFMESILRSAGEGIYGINIAEKTIFANPMVTKITGWNLDDLSKNSAHDLLNHTRLDGTPYPWRECPTYLTLQQKMIQQVRDEIFWRKDGTFFPVEYTSTPIEQNDEIMGAVVVFRDMTAQRRIEQQFQRNYAILSCISRLQNLFINDGTSERLFDSILIDILQLTDSEYGFINELLIDSVGQQYQQALTISNIVWNDETRHFYEQNVPSGFKFYQFDSLNAAAIMSGKVVIANDLAHDPRCCGRLPEGHPPLHSFLGIPLRVKNEIIGSIGLANRAGGYDAGFEQYLQPVIDVIAQIIDAYRNEQKRHAAEEALMQSNARFDDLVACVSVGVYVFSFRADGGMGFEYVSPRFCQILGVAEQAVLADANLAFAIAHPDDHDHLMHANAEARQTLQPFRWEGRLIIHDEIRYISIESNPTPLSGGTSRWNGIVTDITERKHVEQKLRDESKKNEALLSMASDGIHLLDKNGNVVLFSDSFAKMLGYSNKETAKLNVKDWDVMIPQEQLMNEVQRFMESPTFFETKHCCKDGSIIDVEINAKGVELNNHMYLYASARNITDRKYAEAALIQSEQRFRTLFENMQTGFVLHEIITDATGQPIDYIFLLANDAYLRMTGFDPQAISGRRITEVYPEIVHDTTDWIRFYGEIALNGGHRHIESYAEGLDHWYDVIAYSPQPQQFAVLMTDITQRKQTETALQRSEERLLLATRAGGIGIWDFDLKNDILTWDDAMFFLYGLQRDDYSSTYAAWQDCLHHEDRERFNNEVQEAINGSKPFNSEFRVVHTGGAIHHIKAYGDVYRNAQDQPIRMLGVNWDITEQKLIEAEVRRSNHELEQFSYSISHDMRQPLRMITSYLQLLQMSLDTQLDEEQREYIHFAVDGAKRLDAMLLGLLEYSRIGRKGEPPSWVETRTVLEDALLFLGPAITDAGANIRIDGEWPRFWISPNELLRLLQNLLGNALKFRVAERTPEIIVSSNIIKNHWQLQVTDNGIGILPDQTARLFQVFQRLQSHTAYEGSGIGLAVCRKIVERYGGRIWVESSGDGNGCTFWVVWAITDALHAADLI